MAFITDYAARLETFSRFSRSLGARADYVQGGGGNTSVKLDGQMMAIKASGYCLSDIAPGSAYAVLDYAALRRWYRDNEPSGFEDVEKAGSEQAKALTQAIQELQALRPSVEAGFHSLLDTYVGHTHSVWANLAACCLEAGDVMAQALKGAGYNWVIVPYVDPGARLTFAMRDALDDAKAREGSTPQVVLMRSHGVIAHHHDADKCLEIHEDMNRRMAGAFGLSFGDFPAATLKQAGEEHFISDTPWLHERLKGGAYPDSMLLEQPLYPDQMVFFRGTLGGAMQIDRDTGKAVYHMPRKTAQTLEDTLCAVLFITQNIRRRGLTLTGMGEAAQQFISGWESEKYRKGLAEGKA